MSNIKKLVLNSGQFQIDASEPTKVRFLTSNNRDIEIAGSVKVQDIFIQHSNGIQTSLGQMSEHKFINVYMIDNTIPTNLPLQLANYKIKGIVNSDIQHSFILNSDNSTNEFNIQYVGTEPCICLYNLCFAYGVTFSNRPFKVSLTKNNVIIPSTIFHAEGFGNQINTLSTNGMFNLTPNATLSICLQGLISINDITVQDLNLNLSILNHV